MAQRQTIGNIIAPWRFLIFLAALIIGVPVVTRIYDSFTLGAMMGFDVAALLCLALCIPLLRTKEPQAISRHAAENDANRMLLLIFTAIVMLVLFLAIAAETMGRNPQPLTKYLIIATMIIAWLFSNTMYAFHYGHLVYPGGSNGKSSGLDFPGTKAPLYWDFIYFAYTIGMTFQTSDVTISNDKVRRVVTLHSLAAFAFNIGVLAFTINVLGGY